jgi:hypothetical protein
MATTAFCEYLRIPSNSLAEETKLRSIRPEREATGEAIRSTSQKDKG